jgi:pyruvate/2-oxoglutarate dehydrogenase complex dihydrolipoamide acyltransferase (E2) component
MITKLKMPRVGENVSSVFVVELLAQIGTRVNEGDTILLVETDKATVEIAAPCSGTLTEFLVKIDEEVTFGQAYASMETEA